MTYLLRVIYILALVFALAGCARARYARQIEPVIYRPYREPVWEQSMSRKPEPPKPVRKELIVIDAGHGGEDHGATSPFPPRYMEKGLNLVTAKMVKQNLESMGYRTMMTRDKDVAVPLQERALFANKLPTTLFVSVHFNSAPSAQADGIEIFYFKDAEDNERSNASKSLAQAILKRVLETTQANSRGVKHGNLAVVRETKMPAVLIEGGFLTNADEMKKIQDPEYRKSLAFGIASGINDYLTQ